VCYNPKTGGKETGEEAIKRPKGETCEGIQEWIGQSQLGRVDEWVKRDGGLVDTSDGNHVHNAGAQGTQAESNGHQDMVTHMYEADRRAERLKQWGLGEGHTMRRTKEKETKKLRNDTEEVLDWDVVYEVGALLDGRHCRGVVVVVRDKERNLGGRLLIGRRKKV
jgi:hypothetical protein